MSSDGSISEWLERLEVGDQEAAALLWNRYFQRLAVVARHRLPRKAQAARDEEDVALSVLDSVFNGVAHGRFPKLKDRTGLWRLLLTTMKRRLVDEIRRATRHKRGDGRVHGESVLGNAKWEQLAEDHATPATLVELHDNLRHLLDLLPDQKLRDVALWKLQGYSHDEIAARLDCATKSVQRKLRLIRELWSEEITAWTNQSPSA